MEILRLLEGAKSDSIKKIFIDFVKEYITPSYGSMSKRDFEILLFMKLQELKVIDKDPDLYSLIKNLKISRSRARNLLYEAKMRSSNDKDLDKELIELLTKPIFLKDGDRIAIEIQNPLITDHFRFKLKELGHITDGSFSPELVKLNYVAYIALADKLSSNEVKANIVKLFVEEGIMKDCSFKAVFSEIVKKIGHKIAGKAGEVATDQLFQFLSPITRDSVKYVSKGILDLFKSENGDEKSKKA